MYAQAQAELYGRSIHTTEGGFIIYKPFEDGSVYLHLLYVEPSKRQCGIGRQLTDEVIEKTGAKVVISYVDLTTNNPEVSVAAHIAYGMKIRNSDETSITFYKEIA